MKAQIVIGALCVSSVLSAATITGLFDTGASTTGTADNYWTVVAPPGSAQVITLNPIPNTWLANTADSKWVWVNTNAQPTGSPQSIVSYTFRISFTLDGTFNPNTVNITGRWATDNTGSQIAVNGHNTNQTSPAFDTWSAFTLNNFFIAGVNTIDFTVQDYGEVAGFRAEFLTGDALVNTPEPTTIGLLGAGLAGMLFLRRRSVLS